MGIYLCGTTKGIRPETNGGSANLESFMVDVRITQLFHTLQEKEKYSIISKRTHIYKREAATLQLVWSRYVWATKHNMLWLRTRYGTHDPCHCNYSRRTPMSHETRIIVFWYKSKPWLLVWNHLLFLWFQAVRDLMMGWLPPRTLILMVACIVTLTHWHCCPYNKYSSLTIVTI